MRLLWLKRKITSLQYYTDQTSVGIPGHREWPSEKQSLILQSVKKKNILGQLFTRCPKTQILRPLKEIIFISQLKKDTRRYKKLFQTLNESIPEW